MIVPHFFIFVMGLLFSCRISVSVIDGSRRPKRIIGGDELYEKDRSLSPIKALDYYVWIGYSWLCHEDISKWNKLWRFVSPTGADENPLVYALQRLACPPEDPEHLNCGGSLITPRIVQTACHCIADMIPDTFIRIWRAFKIRTQWENNMIVYMGKTEVGNFVFPILAYRFAAHQKCGQLNRKPWYFRFDIGWIILPENEEIPQSLGLKRGAWARLDYAGPYRLDDLNEFYHKVIDQRQVCLVCGYGATKLNDLAPSKTFKFGWMQVLDFKHCYEVTWKSQALLHTFASYNSSISWACLYPVQPWNPSKPMPTIGAQYYRGDSGSPITCGDNYFALVSSITTYKWLTTGYWNISLPTTIQSTPESNSIEYRREFEGKVLFGRYNPDNLRVLKFPNGSIHFQTLKYSGEKFMNKPHKTPERVLMASSLSSIPSIITCWISLFQIFL